MRTNQYLQTYPNLPLLIHIWQPKLPY